MEYLIDVIIPLYNRTEYVDDLIGNLEKQNMRKFRAIFVDDGSTDGTYELLSEKLESVSFPHVLLKKENGGAASARNMGLKHADAPWVGFIDSDDIAQPEYLEYLYKAATEAEADLAVCSFGEISSMEDAANHQAGELEYKVISPAECMKNYCTSWLGVYCLLIKQSLVRENELYFDEECRLIDKKDFIYEVEEEDKTEFFATFFKEYYNTLSLEFPDKIVSNELENKSISSFQFTSLAFTKSGII